MGPLLVLLLVMWLTEPGWLSSAQRLLPPQLAILPPSIGNALVPAVCWGCRSSFANVRENKAALLLIASAAPAACSCAPGPADCGLLTLTAELSSCCGSNPGPEVVEHQAADNTEVQTEPNIGGLLLTGCLSLWQLVGNMNARFQCMVLYPLIYVQ